MAVTAYTYAKMNLNALLGKIPDLSAIATTVKVALLTDNYTPAQNRHEVYTAPAWQGTTSYNEGDYVIPSSASGNIYRCSVAGTSGETEPEWPLIDTETITDGDIAWECVIGGNLAFYEVTGDGYTAGGTEILNKTLFLNEGAAVFDGDDVSWPDSSITARYAVVYEEENNLLLAYQDFGENKATSDTAFTVQWHTDGIAVITAEQS